VSLAAAPPPAADGPPAAQAAPTRPVGRPAPRPGSPVRHPSGLTLEVRGGRLVIAAVAPGSPAEGAGLLRGDVALVVNGYSLVDLDPLSPEGALQLFGRSLSGEVRLVVGRGSGTLSVVLPDRPGAGPAGPEPIPAPPAPGAPAPDVPVRDMRGKEFTLASLRGKPVLIVFWASWCAPCRAESIALRRIADQYEGRLEIVGVSLDEDRRAFEAFVYNQHLPGRQVFDGGWFGPVARRYGVAATGIPCSVLVDRESRIVAVAGPVSEIEEAIARQATGAAG
jgi:thiol-disulfide isomerase/thioredoxin